MSFATHLPRCPARLATQKRHRRRSSLLAVVLVAMSLTTASMPAPAEESHDRFVGPPSRLQPRLANETGTPRVTAVPEDWQLDGSPTRVSKRELDTTVPPASAVGYQENGSVSTTALVNPFAQAEPLLVGQAPPGNSDQLRLSQAEPDLREPQPTPTPQLPMFSEPQLAEPPATEEPIAAGEPLPCYVARPISEITANIALPAGALPKNAFLDCTANASVVNDPRMQCGWAQFDFHWAATCLCHRPLYFEETNAERYGYTVSYLLQPVISAGHFFLTIPALPYKMAVDRPHDCIYTLGHYRPGDCVPWRTNHLPLAVGAAIVEVGTIAGLILLVP